MDIENQYLAVLDLTHRMAKAADQQEWDQLTALEQQRSALVAAIPALSKAALSSDPDAGKRIARLIDEIERESGEILEQVQVWQKHVRILLRLDQPADA